MMQAPLPESLALPPLLSMMAETDEGIREKIHRLAENVVVTVTPRTVTGRRLQDDRGELANRNIHEYDPHPEHLGMALITLENLGFTIHRQSRFSITVSASAERIRQVLGVPLGVHRRRSRPAAAVAERFVLRDDRPRAAELFVSPASPSVRSREESMDHFVFIPPPLLYAASPTPPVLPYQHLTAADVRRLLSIPNGASPADVRLAVIDTGFFDHPYYEGLGIDFHQVPGGPARGEDAVGHGTAVTWNVCSTIPGASTVVLGYSSAVQDAIEIAAEEELASVISCSWGWDHEQVFPVLEASIRSVVEDDGICVLVAAGNGQISWPASMPEVISVGGVYADPANHARLRASTYASGFASSMYPGRSVPDVSGLCGDGPRGIYFPMPCPPGSELDESLGGANFPDADGTSTSDGWVVSSGTSSATPQVAAVVALMIAKGRALGKTLTPKQIKDILTSTAKPVTTGRNALGFPAAGHPNVACGFGLVDAAAALERI